MPNVLPSAEKLALEALTNYSAEDQLGGVLLDLRGAAEDALYKLMRPTGGRPRGHRVEIDPDDGADLIETAAELALDFYEKYMSGMASAFSKSLRTSRR